MNRLNFPAGALLLVTLALNGCGRPGANRTGEALPAASVQAQVVESKSRVATEEDRGHGARQIALGHRSQGQW